ncbi:MAG: glycosyltransferase involved in cell wall biosynthesis [Candidatus Omnitrophota bacterium]|jgi:glycosyltransferase involved in cell wall biosynthesis
MKIAYDHSIEHFAAGGTATYTRELRKRLPTVDPAVQIDGFSCERSTDGGWLRRKKDVVNWQLAWPNKLNRRCAVEGYDLLHVTSSVAPRHPSLPVVFTEYDISPLLEPRSYSRWHNAMFRHYTPRMVEVAKHIITISEFTRQEMLRYFPTLKEDRITAIPLGVDALFTRADEETQAEVLTKYGLRRPYILSVCSLGPRKNMGRLVEAFRRIRDRVEQDLVLVGEPGKGYGRLVDYIDQMHLTGRVHVTGYVDREELPALYSAADLFAYPSLYEGFGLPPLEAMACGCPVMTSNVSSLPEVVGDAAVTVDPLDIQDIIRGLSEPILDEQYRQELRVAGMARAATFTWERTAEETVAVYRSVLQQG